VTHTIQPSQRTQLAAMNVHIVDKRTDRKKMLLEAKYVLVGKETS